MPTKFTTVYSVGTQPSGAVRERRRSGKTLTAHGVSSVGFSTYMPLVGPDLLPAGHARHIRASRRLKVLGVNGGAWLVCSRTTWRACKLVHCLDILDDSYNV